MTEFLSIDTLNKVAFALAAVGKTVPSVCSMGVEKSAQQLFDFYNDYPFVGDEDDERFNIGDSAYLKYAISKMPSEVNNYCQSTFGMTYTGLSHQSGEDKVKHEDVFDINAFNKGKRISFFIKGWENCDNCGRGNIRKKPVLSSSLRVCFCEIGLKKLL